MLNTERLKALRKNANYKQIDVANLLGVGRTTYAKYESGDIQPPNDQVIKIANLFQISSDFLLNLSDDPTPLNKKNALSDKTERANYLMQLLIEKGVVEENYTHDDLSRIADVFSANKEFIRQILNKNK